MPNTFAGRALDEAGQPIANAEAFLFRVRHDGSQRQPIGQKTTDTNGNFQFDKAVNIDVEFPNKKFPPLNETGEVYLELVLRAKSHASLGRTLLPQVIAQLGDYQELMLPAAATLTGKITGPKGNPVAGAVVSVENGGVGQWDGASSSRTAADGVYTIADAMPFDRVAIQKQIGDESFPSPKLSITHPDHAAIITEVEKLPGAKDVKLAPSATLEGQVVFADGKPAAGATIGVATSFAINLGDPPGGNAPTIYKAAAVADANGKYKITSLPSGLYDLWADLPGWVNAGVVAVAAPADKTAVMPDLVITKGGRIRVQLVDASTNAPILLNARAKARLTIEQMTRPAGRPVPNHVITPNADGLFEIQAVPGKPLVLIGGVEIDGAAKWHSEKPAVVTVVDAEAKNVDVPVVDVAAMAAAIQQNSNPQQPNAPLPPLPPPPAPTNDDLNKGAALPKAPQKNAVDLNIVVAKHVLLLNGKEIITWEDLEKKVAALPDPTKVSPQFYLTRGLTEAGGYEAAKTHIWELHSKYKLKGHSVGSLWPRADLRYDRIKNASDLKPDESLRMEGTVTNQQGKPVAGAEVILVTPVDDSISYKTVDIALVEGRLRNPLEEVVTETDAQGRFVIYPPRLRGPEGHIITS